MVFNYIEASLSEPHTYAMNGGFCLSVYYVTTLFSTLGSTDLNESGGRFVTGRPL